MRSIDAREDPADRRVPGRWEGDLIIGAHGKSAAATLVEGTTRFTVILALPEGKDSTGLADVLIDNANELPAMMGKTLTWDQGSQMAKDAAVSLATSMPVFFAHAHSPRERGTARHVHVRTAAHREPEPRTSATHIHLIAVAKHRAEGPRTNMPVLTRPGPVSEGSLVQPTSDIRAGDFEN